MGVGKRRWVKSRKRTTPHPRTYTCYLSPSLPIRWYQISLSFPPFFIYSLCLFFDSLVFVVVGGCLVQLLAAVGAAVAVRLPKQILSEVVNGKGHLRACLSAAFNFQNQQQNGKFIFPLLCCRVLLFRVEKLFFTRGLYTVYSYTHASYFGKVSCFSAMRCPSRARFFTGIVTISIGTTREYPFQMFSLY